MQLTSKILGMVVLTTGLLLHVNAFSQRISESLGKSINETQTNLEIMNEVQEYFATLNNENDGFESKELKWIRRAWHISNHLGPNGSFVNTQALNWKAAKAMKAMQTMQSNNQRTLNSEWIFEGPSGSTVPGAARYNGLGRVDRIAFHPTDPDIIYLGAPAGGLWKTENGGQNWINLTDNIPSIAVSGIVVSNNNPDEIYILTGDGDSNTSHAAGWLLRGLGYLQASVGILKSTDGGVTWLTTGELPGSDSTMVGFQLVQDPNDDSTLLAATSSGLYRTPDGGDTWTKAPSISTTYDVLFHPTNSSIAYASTPGKVHYSDDNGENWTPVKDYGNSEKISLAVSADSIDMLYVLAGGSPADGTFNGFFADSIEPTNLTVRSTTPNILGTEPLGDDGAAQSTYIQAMAVSASDASKVAVGGFTMWTSSNGGSTWTRSASYNETDATDTGVPYIHPDVHDVEYNPLNDFLYVATDGGFFKSEDHGETWEDLSEGVNTTMFFHYRTWNGSSAKAMGGNQDNGVKYKDGFSSIWQHISCCDGFDVAFDPLTGEPRYATINRSMSRYTMDGAGTDSVTQPTETWFKTLAVHNTMPEVVFLGDAFIYKSEDSGLSWDISPLGVSGTWALTSCPTNNDRFYAAGGIDFKFADESTSGLFVTSDVGATWSKISDSTGFPASWNKITDIGVSPISSALVFATFGGYNEGEKVYVSNNAGASWSNYTENLPNVPVYCISVDNDLSVYIGTEIGVFYRKLGMLEWMPWSNGLPMVPVTGINVQDQVVRCATMGRGAWMSVKASDCIGTLQLVMDQDGIRHYEASDGIVSLADVLGGAGTFVSLKAGNYIEFIPGVEIKTGNTLQAELGPCGQGGIPEIWQPGGSSSDRTDREIDFAYPLGWMNSARIDENTNVDIKFNVREAGNIEFKLEGKGRSETIFTSDYSTGLKSTEIALENTPSGFYHLVMYNDGRVAHFQELKID